MGSNPTTCLFAAPYLFPPNGMEDFHDFAKEIMERNGYVVLHRSEIDEVRTSLYPENHIIAAKYVDRLNSLLIIRGDYKTINVPVFNIPLIGNDIATSIDFSQIKLEDLGLTIRFGDISLNSQILTISFP